MFLPSASMIVCARDAHKVLLSRPYSRAKINLIRESAALNCNFNYDMEGLAC